jgi:hypothetical protein
MSSAEKQKGWYANAMGSRKTAEAQDAATLEAQDLIGKLQDAKTSGDLWKVAQTEEFKTAAALLSDDALSVLRDAFKAFDIMLKGKVKAEDVAGEVLRVMAWDFNTSPQFPDSEFVVLKGTREEKGGEKFELLSGAKRIVRYFQDKDPREVPQRIMLIQETAEEMATRDAKAGTSPMWIVKRMSGGAKASAGTPF